MVLVDYSDSDTDVDEPSDNRSINAVDFQSRQQQNPPPNDKRKKRKPEEDDDDAGLKRSRPPPLPSSLHSQYATNTRSSINDDPSLHGGRQRQVPHVRGHWPSHVYLEWYPSNDQFVCLEKLISQQRNNFEPLVPTAQRPQIHSFLQSALNVQLPLHVSLSAPLVLSTNGKDDFGSKMTDKIKVGGIQAFTVQPVSLDWVSNFEESRFFLVLRLSHPEDDQLNALLDLCNEVCRDFDLPLLYHHSDAVGIASRHARDKSAHNAGKLDAFHISIAWTLDEPSQTTKQAAREKLVHDIGVDDIFFETVKVKIGNSVADQALMPNSSIHKPS